MLGISGEHLIIMFVVLLIFGPRRLPELGNTMGKAMRNFKDAISGVEEAKYRKIDEDTSRPAGSETPTGPIAKTDPKPDGTQGNNDTPQS